MSLVLDEHRQYLGDASRVSAFRQAIEEVVTPGDVVLDLGAGTGILGLMACRAGAKRVYAVDEGPIIGLAREIAEANGFHDRITHIKGLSTRVELPERVDVVLADQIGRFGLESGILEYFGDARERFLKPGGVMVPGEIRLVVAPVESQELFGQIEFWSRAPAGFDFRAARTIAANTGYPARFDSAQLLGAPARVISLKLSTASMDALSAEVILVAVRPGTLHGIGGWFEAQLSPGVTLTNSPLAARPIFRMQVFFPIARPVVLEEHDEVRVRLRLLPAGAIVSWNVDVRDGHAGHGSAPTSKGRFAHSTFQGMLLCKEDLERTDLQFVPRLSPWGQARRSVLELCDGRRALGDIEREVHRRHPAIFQSPAEAAAFVTEVVTRYAV
jgi:Ribosomal protein L11 methyltransferase (PrmA)/Arginine methyltransferase oligomerization subdomain